MKTTLILIFYLIPLLSIAATGEWSIDNQNSLITKCSKVIEDEMMSDTRKQFSLKKSDPIPVEIEFQIKNTIIPRIKKVCLCTVNDINTKYSYDKIENSSEILLNAIMALKGSKTGCAKLFEEQPEEFSKPEFHAQLIKLEKKDQEVRKITLHAKNMSKKELSNINSVDIDIQNKLKELPKQYGWPTKKDIGTSGLNRFALLLVHADNEMRSKALPYFKSLFEKGDIGGQYVALLTDKLLVSKGKNQLYGTQLTTINGKLVLSPIEDRTNVDARRKKMGMMSLDEYIKFTKTIEQ